MRICDAAIAHVIFAALVGGGPRFTLNVALVAMENGATDKL